MRRLIATLVSCATAGALPLVTAGPAAADPRPEPFSYVAPEYDIRGPYIGADDPWWHGHHHNRHHGDHQWDGDRPWDGDRDKDDDRCKDDDDRHHGDHRWDDNRWDGDKDDDHCKDDDDRYKDDDRYRDEDGDDDRYRNEERDDDDRYRDGDRDWGYNYRYVTSLRCRLGGGAVVRSWHSPTRLACYGGRYNGYWVVSYGL
ncbi:MULTISPECIES: hypothetical protein [unclassified Nonomuraea]|uniref:hypothetical protein n=1 Tax=unclassified Nonomuraea TaxID=2593643 RepID=UPI00342F1B7C